MYLQALHAFRMLLYTSFGTLVGAASLALPISFGLPAEPHRLQSRATGSLASFITAESPIAVQGVLNNIGPNGSKAPGASAGIVIASPSTSNPNCMCCFASNLKVSTARSGYFFTLHRYCCILMFCSFLPYCRLVLIIQLWQHPSSLTEDLALLLYVGVDYRTSSPDPAS